MIHNSFIGPYRLLDELGNDGMGVVYRARHVNSEQAVALKTVKISAPRWLSHIRREIHTLTRVHHPGLVRIHEHGVHDGLPWYAMDLLEGEKLSQYIARIWSRYTRGCMPRGLTDPVSDTGALREARPPKAEAVKEERHTVEGRPPAAAGEMATALRLMRRICATLAFLHGEGFVHRDLKPGNVMLVAGDPIIFDLGLAAQHPGGTGREEIDSQDTNFGTIPYMSPEQIRGEFVDARSDLYSVGCILYELVTREPPFFRALDHLCKPPRRPSELVAELPPRLEQLILKLMEKDVAARYGFADEVADVLADIARDVPRHLDWPPARPYLYRPSFVGRREVVSKLGCLRDQAVGGTGSFALLAGESGVGKTRVAMELTRLGPRPLRVVTSEATSLSFERGDAVGAAPLQAVRPLLRAVADRCQEFGPEVTERLLGHHRSVLSLYEPLLGQVPARDSSPPVHSFGPEASRRRLLEHLTEVLSNFAAEEPLLWIIDDVGWADELSLAFLQSLSPEFLQKTPVFVLATYRSEEATDAVRTLAARNDVVHMVLPRLDRHEVRSIIADMLALPTPWEEFVEWVGEQAEGNPFFVSEYVRAAVAERFIFRERHETWGVRDLSGEAKNEFPSIRLPRSLHELLERRLGALSQLGQTFATAAAVLGREVDMDTLRAVVCLSDDAFLTAAEELVDRQIFEDVHENRVRFAHDKLREVAYARLPRKDRIAFHGRAGQALAQRHADSSAPDQPWAAIGYHFAAADLAGPAAEYLRKAANHARSTYANADAIRLYGEAIEQTEHLLLDFNSDTDWRPVVVELCEARADVLTMVGRRAEARTSYEQALGRVPESDPAVRARVHRKIGKTWELQHDHDRALFSYNQAEQILPPAVTQASAPEQEEWMQVRIEKQWLHYWRADLPAMDAMVTALTPAIDEFGSPLQRVRFFGSLVLRNHRRDRFISSEETLRFARAAVQACPASARFTELPMAIFVLGFTLLFHGSISDAVNELQSAVALAVRAGDSALQARCYTYLSVAARLQRRDVEVAAFADLANRSATAAGQREYIAAAQAQGAWLRLRQGKITEAVEMAKEAIALWKSLPLEFPFRWMALIPLLDAHLSLGHLEDAIASAEALIDPTQQFLPGQATDALERALRLWHAQERVAATQQLRGALRHLDQQHFN